MDTIDFNDFDTTGVLGTDTFETWRQKTNGIVEKIGIIDSSYVSESEVLLLDNTSQTVGANKTFGSGLTIAGGGGTVTLTANSSSALVLSNNLLVDGDKSVSGNSLISRSGSISIGGKNYSWPTDPIDWNDGYVYHAPNGDILFKTTAELVSEVLEDIGTATLVATQEITPVGTIVGIKLTPVAATAVLDTVWLKCDGSTFVQADYPELYAALGNTNVLPDLRSKVLVGSSGATGFIDSTAVSGTSFYSVYHYIKALPDNVTSFSLTSGNGVNLLGQGSSSSINIYGGTISLNVGPEFTFDVNKRLLLSTGGVSHTKLANSSTSVTTGVTGVPLRDSDGYVRGNTPGIVSPSSAGAILTNKAYVDNLLGSKDHKVRSLNGKGFNSYGVQPTTGCVFVNYDSQVKVYGLTNETRGRRYGSYGEPDACGHSLPLYNKNVTKVYSDTLNTYIKYDDNTVYSYGLNSNRKSGVATKSVNSAHLTGPAVAFGGNTINEVILSYDLNSETAYALTTDGRLWVAGSNAYGQLGLNSNLNSTSSDFLPSAYFPRGRTISKAWLIGGGATQTGYVLATDGTLWACGYGNNGQMGRILIRSTNPEWVPVLNPDTVTYNGGTTGYNTTTKLYTSASNHGLQDYDVVKTGLNHYVVKVTDSTKFTLHTSDALTTFAPQVTFSPSTIVYKRMSGIVDAAFGGLGANTFAYLQKTDGTLYAWGYGTNGQLGNGSAAHKSIPTIVAKTSGSAVKAQKVYTGLDYAVHFISTTQHLYACGDNRLGQLGIGQNGGNLTSFEKIDVSHLVDTTLQITNNDYSVYRFFSAGTDSRFCTFQSGTNRKLTAWGANNYNKLGADNNANSYNRPQNVYVSNDSEVYDVQTTAIVGGNTDVSTMIIKDDSLEYGDLHTCGYHHYNLNDTPNRTIMPYFTKVKSI